MDPGRRAVETREVEYVRVGDRVVSPDGVQHVVLEVVAHDADAVVLRLGRLHGDEVRDVVTRRHAAGERVRVRVPLGPTA